MKILSLLPASAVASACATFVLAACATPLVPVERVEQAPAPAGAFRAEYGTIRNIEIVDTAAAPGAGGALLGGVVGGLLGHTIGEGGGRAAASVLGVVGGAVVGNEIEKREDAARTGRIYRVVVQFDTGETRTFDYHELDGLRAGDRVRFQDGRLGRA